MGRLFFGSAIKRLSADFSLFQLTCFFLFCFLFLHGYYGYYVRLAKNTKNTVAFLADQSEFYDYDYSLSLSPCPLSRVANFAMKSVVD